MLEPSGRSCCCWGRRRYGVSTRVMVAYGVDAPGGVAVGFLVYPVPLELDISRDCALLQGLEAAGMQGAKKRLEPRLSHG